ncbi:MAG: hypothetical protein IH589_03660 [Anaerolineales bacterium]|nr:hypothetical protein [Anaerolineales bacterium]
MSLTGAARRIGRSLSVAVAQTGADVAIHYDNSRSEAIPVFMRRLLTLRVRCRAKNKNALATTLFSYG